MRWKSLAANTDQADALPLALPEAGLRRYATPGFAGLTFYEIRAKSIINRVPAGSRVPFEWTINPYRGCSHACAYCLAPDTRVRMADRSTKPISELLVGDAVLGSVPDGYSRRFAETTVLARWSSVKRAYRVSLENGVTLVASGDHRFLTHRGWKHVSSCPDDATGESRRYLIPGDRLLGIGRHAEPSADTLDALIGVTAVEALEGELEMFDITTGTGDFIANDVVSHNCFARNTHTYLDLDAGHDFDSKIVVKVNAPDLVRRELAAPGWTGAHVAMGTNVDCYQRAEGRYRLMPGIIEALRDHANPFSILTKATLITRDLPLLRQAAEVTSVGVSFSVGFVDEELWHSVESGTPSPRRRLDAVRQFAEAGFAVTVLMAPILPGLTDTDESIEETVAAIAATGASRVVPLPLHLRPGAREWYLAWLGRTHPELSQRYTQLFRGGSYASAGYQREVTARVREAARRHGLRPEHATEHRGPESAERHGDPAERHGDPAEPRADRAGARPDAAEQLALL